MRKPSITCISRTVSVNAGGASVNDDDSSSDIVVSRSRTESDAVFDDVTVDITKLDKNTLVVDANGIPSGIFRGRLLKMMRYAGIALVVYNVIVTISLVVAAFADYSENISFFLKILLRYGYWACTVMLGPLIRGVQCLGRTYAEIPDLKSWGTSTTFLSCESNRWFGTVLVRALVACTYGVSFAFVPWFTNIPGHIELSITLKIAGILYGPAFVLSLAWIVTVHVRVMRVTQHILLGLIVQPSLSQCYRIHRKIQLSQENVEDVTKQFITANLLSLGIALIVAVFGAFTYRPFKILFFAFLFVFSYFCLLQMARVNDLDAAFVKDVAETFRFQNHESSKTGHGGFHRVYAAIKLLELHPLQFDVLGVAITQSLLNRYMITGIVTLLASLQELFWVIVNSGYV